MKKVFKTAAVLALVVSSGQALSDCDLGETRLDDGGCGVWQLGRFTFTAPSINDPWNIPNYQEWDNRDERGDRGRDDHGGGGSSASADPDPDEDDDSQLCNETETRQFFPTSRSAQDYNDSRPDASSIGIFAGGVFGAFISMVSGAFGDDSNGAAATLLLAGAGGVVGDWLQDALSERPTGVLCGSTVITRITVCTTVSPTQLIAGNSPLITTRAVDTWVTDNPEQCEDPELPPGMEPGPGVH